MTQTKFDVASRALVRVGKAPVVAFGTTSAEEIACATEYEGAVEAAMAAYRWRFATDLYDLGNPLVDAPVALKAYAFQLPAELTILHGVYLAGTETKIPYDRFGSKIYCDYSGGIVAEYGFRAPENVWPPHFTKAFVEDLASTFAQVLARNQEMADKLFTKAVGLWSAARTTDSQQQTTRKIGPSRLVAVRR